jgi:hypothetical protein
MNPVPPNFLLLKSMFIYQPYIDSSDRVIWHGGESTQLHYEQRDKTGDWIECAVRTLGGGIPTGMSEMHAELVDYYNHCQTAPFDI